MTAPLTRVTETADASGVQGHAGLSPQAAAVLGRAGSVPPRSLDRASWDEVLARAAKPRRDWRLIPAFGLSVTLGALLVLVFRTPGPVGGAHAPAAIVTPDANAKFTHTAEGERITLAEGRLSIAGSAALPMVVQTPHVELRARQSRFLAEVTSSGTRIAVEEGEVVVRTPRGDQVVRAGQTLFWPPIPEIPTALLDAPVDPSRSCAQLAVAERVGCLRAESQGAGLEAQAALFELGQLQARAGEPRAAELTWRSSLSRFPNGVLHPEVRLALLVELVRSRRFDDARQAAEEFERTCADDPRLQDVASLRRALEP